MLDSRDESVEFESEAGRADDDDAAALDASAAAPCPACGGPVRRSDAQFCATCGRRLDEHDYFPTDSLRASYHQQLRRSAPAASRRSAPAPSPRTRPVARHNPHDKTARSAPRRGTDDLFERNRNGASTTALAFVTYSLVPYLGILFCPGAFLMGCIGMLRAHRQPHVGGRRASLTSIVLAFVILGVQLLLWWILYKVPEWSRQSPF